MCQHLYSRSIAEIVLKLLLLEGIQKSNEESEENEDFYKDQRVELLGLVLETYRNCQDDDEVFDNISYIIVDILQNAANNTEKYQNQYLNHLVEKLSENETKKVFLSKLEDPSKLNFYSVFFSLSVLNQLIVFQTTDKKNQTNQDDGETVTHDDCDFEFFSTNLPTLVQIFENKTLHIQVSDDSEEKFGLVRLKLVELLHNLIKINDERVNERLQELNVLKILLDDFKRFHNHNIFHNFLEHIVETILIKNDSQKMKKNLLQTNLFQSFLEELQQFQLEEAQKQSSTDSTKSQSLFSNQTALRLNKASIRNTQSGFYYKFLNLYFEKKTELRKLISDNEDLCKQLDSVESGFYKNVQDLNKYILGGEEQQENNDQNEIDVDHIGRAPWAIYDNKKSNENYSNDNNNDNNDQGKDDDDDDEDDDYDPAESSHKHFQKEDLSSN